MRNILLFISFTFFFGLTAFSQQKCDNVIKNIFPGIPIDSSDEYIIQFAAAHDFSRIEEEHNPLHFLYYSPAKKTTFNNKKLRGYHLSIDNADSIFVRDSTYTNLFTVGCKLDFYDVQSMKSVYKELKALFLKACEPYKNLPCKYSSYGPGIKFYRPGQHIPFLCLDYFMRQDKTGLSVWITYLREK